MAKDTLVNFDRLRGVLEQYAQDVRNLYQDKLIESDRLASGELLNGIDYRVDFDGQTYEVKLSLEHYWKYVEFGTSPHWPPTSALLRWIEIKPVIPTPDASGRIPSPQSLAFLIGRKIAAKGTRGSYDLQDALDEMNEKYRNLIVYAIRDDVANLIKLSLGHINGSIPEG